MREMRSRVLVGMSGGVDSSVAAAVLLDQGHDVVGVIMKLWDGPPSAKAKLTHGCYGPAEFEDIEDAGAVARHLGIPLHVVDMSKAYHHEVLDYFESEYRSGRTPNPCSRCNPRIKFGALVDKARAIGIEFDFFATGHYARVEHFDSPGRQVLKKGTDPAKDQSYFLALLSQEQLGRSLFPLGSFSKTDVRDMAKRYGLPVALKPDSQDFADADLALHTEEVPGPILTSEGVELGRHRGISNYTIGQRKGLGLSGAAALYVCGIDVDKNAVIVGKRDALLRRRLIASNVNWISIDAPTCILRVAAKIRARHNDAGSDLYPADNGRIVLQFDEPQTAITPGQTVVFYDGDIVLGAGVIERSEG
jgi:tRNA-uridine 2-sulfurtransferase